jgi:hypothetical protein
MAEHVGFEPTEPFQVRLFSKEVPSTTRSMFHVELYDTLETTICQASPL